MNLLVVFIGILALVSGAVSQHIGGTIEMIECRGCEDILERPVVAYPKLVGYGAHDHEGVIGIQALIDRAGDVVSAKALYGHPYFRSMLERAAEQAKFKAARSESKRKAIFVFKVTPPTSETPIIGHAPPGIKPVYLPTPEYPPAASFVGLDGKVEVSLTVDEKGTVTEARIISGHPFFHSSSLSAARSAKFEPLRLSGKPVRFRTLIVFEFKRPPDAAPPKLGIVNGRANVLPRPELPQELKNLCASGEVGVEVLINEEGLVAESIAVFGDELLYDSALKAAKKATFRQVADGPPVRSRGIILYNFPAETKCIDAGNVNGKWIKRPSFSMHPHARVSKATKISIRLGIDPFSGKVLAAKTINGQPYIRRALERAALDISFYPTFINTEPFVVRGVITVTVLPNGKVTF